MALAKDKDERFPTAQEMADDLRRALRGESVVAQLPTPVDSPPSRRGGKRSGGRKAKPSGRVAAAGSGSQQASPALLLGIFGLVGLRRLIRTRATIAGALPLGALFVFGVLITFAPGPLCTWHRAPLHCVGLLCALLGTSCPARPHAVSA